MIGMDYTKHGELVIIQFKSTEMNASQFKSYQLS